MGSNNFGPCISEDAAAMHHATASDECKRSRFQVSSDRGRRPKPVSKWKHQAKREKQNLSGRRFFVPTLRNLINHIQRQPPRSPRSCNNSVRSAKTMKKKRDPSPSSPLSHHRRRVPNRGWASQAQCRNCLLFLCQILPLV